MLIVTVAELTPEAIREAAAEGKAKIGLLGGDALVRTCAERGIGVDRRQIVVLEPIPADLRRQWPSVARQWVLPENGSVAPQ
jgi:hypothetical protein